MSLLNRRKFIGQAAAASVLGASAASSILGCADKSKESTQPAMGDAAMHSLQNISVQLYSLRSLMTESVPSVLASVSDIGYNQVEFAGYFDHPAADVRKMLDDNGLTSPSAHVGLELLLDDVDAVLESAATIGHEYLIVPYLGDTLRADISGYKRVCTQMNELGAKCQSAGVQLAYHNHDFEFQEMNGQVPYDVMMAECDPDLVKMQLDLFWITEAGKDPLDYFDRYPGRFHLCHVKDRTPDGAMVDVGKGVIDFKRIFANSESAGLRYYIVEHDNPEDPLASVRASYDYLAALEF